MPEYDPRLDQNDSTEAADAGLMVPATIIHPDVAYPDDRSTTAQQYNHGLPVPFQTGETFWSATKKAFPVSNPNAVPVFERGSDNFNSGQVFVSNTNNQQAICIQGRVKGRKNVTVWVPNTYTNTAGSSVTPTGIVLSDSEGNVINGFANIQLNAGDSMTISTESPVWVGLLPGATSGYCQFVVEYNPSGGELTGL
jgi:hypothetical protein